MRLLKAALACAVVLSLSAPATAAPSPLPAPERYAAEKCADISFHPVGPARIQAGTAYETIAILARFADGRREQVTFAYPWVYANFEANDPWSSSNLRNRDFVTFVQQPPEGFDLTTLPPLVVYVLAHTDARGATNVPHCGRPDRPLTESEVNRMLWRPVDASADAAQIAITNTFLSYGTERLPGIIGMPVGATYSYTNECISFVNRAPRTATRIRFVFSYLAPDGSVLDSDPFDRVGRFATNVLIEGLREGINPTSGPATRMTQNCKKPSLGAMYGSAFELLRSDGRLAVVAGIRVSVDAVDYDDGTTWRASPAGSSGS
jgi:hypothetical protein